MKIWKKWHESTEFLRMDVFWQNMGMRECFLENERFFRKYGHVSSDFYGENRKKKVNSLTFLDHNKV